VGARADTAWRGAWRVAEARRRGAEGWTEGLSVSPSSSAAHRETSRCSGAKAGSAVCPNPLAARFQIALRVGMELLVKARACKPPYQPEEWDGSRQQTEGAKSVSRVMAAGHAS